MKSTITLKLIFISFLLIFQSCSKEDDGPSCPKLEHASFQTAPTMVFLNVQLNQANSYKIEYGPSGFAPGTGTVITTSNSSYDVEGLSPSTTYDFYLSAICNSQEISEAYELLSVTTEDSQCQGTASLEFSQWNMDEIQVYLDFNGYSASEYEVEYGVEGFTQGNGTQISVQGSSFEVSNVEPNTTYDFYVRADCGYGDFSEYSMYQYQTIDACPEPTNLSTYVVSGSCSSGNGATRLFDWNDSYGAAESYTVSIEQDGSSPGNNTFTTSNTQITISGMYCLWSKFYVKSNCPGGESSDWAGPYHF